MGKYSNIEWKNRKEKNGVVIQEGTPIPKEIIEYYKKNGYVERGIPLSADTCREIAELV